MRLTKILYFVALLTICSALTISCKGRKPELKPVKGVLEEPVKEGTAPDLVNATLDRHVIDGNFESILNDTVNNIQVWSLVRCDSVNSSEGFGLVVAKDGRATIFSDIRHGNTPSARYNAATGELWLTGVSIEGTGTHVERFYRIGFRNDGPHYVAGTIDPYEIQQALCQELKYAVKGRDITLYDNDRELKKITSTVTDMGDFFDDAVWVGEQLRYDLSGDTLTVTATPGVNFVTGKVLLYDDMPDLTARVTLNADGKFTLSDINISENNNQ